jgi:hypothetical protein
MAVAVAEAGTAQKAAEILIFCAVRSRDGTNALAGCTHARKVLPADGFAAYMVMHRTIPSRCCAAQPISKS